MRLNNIFNILRYYIWLLFSQNRLWNIPRCNIYETIMPDLLHQVKKGVWSHLLRWFQDLLHDIHDIRRVNEYLDEMDKRFTLVPRFMGIKCFPKGIHCLEQITAAEYAQIMKVFLDIILLSLIFGLFTQTFFLFYFIFFFAII